MQKKSYNENPDWDIIKIEYKTHPISLKELALKYNVSFSNLKSLAAKEGWFKEKKELKKILSDEENITKDDSLKQKFEINQKHILLYQTGLEIIENILKKYLESSFQLPDENKLNPVNLEKILHCIERIQKGQRLALNIDNDEPIDVEPELNFICGVDLKEI